MKDKLEFTKEGIEMIRKIKENYNTTRVLKEEKFN